MSTATPSTQVLAEFDFDLDAWLHGEPVKILPPHAANFYLRLLVECHRHGEIPANPKELAQFLQAPLREVNRYLLLVMPWFEVHERLVQGVYPYRSLRHPQADKSRKRMIALITSASARRSEHIRNAGGNPSPEVRLFIFRRDGYQCRKCYSPEQLTIDHIYPVSKGGTSDISNLQTLCQPCNSRKRDRVEVAF